MRHHITDNEQLRFTTKNNAEVKDLFLTTLIGCGVATPRQFLFSSQKSDTTMQQETFKEIWKPVPGFRDTLFISTLGNVKSLDKTIISKNERRYKLKGVLFKPYLTARGYPSIKFRLDGKRHNLLVHRIVAITFISNPEKKEEVNHIDGNKQNNCIENLEWVSPSENIIHAWNNCLANKNNLKPSNKRVINTQTGEVFDSIKDAARSVNMSSSTLSKYLLKTRVNKTPFAYEAIQTAVTAIRFLENLKGI